ncbi:MAG: hypothetical protein QOC63_5119 [Mycobacterium sp.]|jgi:hypothetical protein|nr:hypothetical protein [Mycobacterium sp.]
MAELVTPEAPILLWPRILRQEPRAPVSAGHRAKGSSDLHPALITGWKNLYGFTSDSGGIRHAGFDGAIQPTQELAQYFLVTCSAFVNLVTSLMSQRST